MDTVHNNSACVLGFPSNKLYDVLREIKSINCVMSMREQVYFSLMGSFETSTILHAVKPPIGVIADSSTLKHWEQLLLHIQNDRVIWAYYEKKEEITSANRNCCLIIPYDGNVVFFKPTNAVIYQRILKKNPEVKELSNRQHLVTLFSQSWLDNLEIFCDHYFLFSY